MPLGQRFDVEKAVEAILYVATRVNDPSFHRISKLLYLADKQHLADYGQLIVGDSYVAMKHGPVPSGVYDLLKAAKGIGRSAYRRLAANAFEVVDDCRLKPLRGPDGTFLSKADIKSLNFAIERFGRLSFQQLTDLGHDSAWESTDENEFIDLGHIALASPGGEEVAEYVQSQRPRRA